MEKPALVLIDIQNDYFPGGKRELSGSSQACQNAAKLLLRFREKGLPVIHVQHESLDPVPRFFAPGTDGMNIHPDVQPVYGEKVIIKHKPSSFFNTGLEAHLEECDVRHIFLAGMQTNVCVKAFVCDPASKSYHISVAHDALAAATNEIHQATLPVLEKESAGLASTERILGMLD